MFWKRGFFFLFLFFENPSIYSSKYFSSPSVVDLSLHDDKTKVWDEKKNQLHGQVEGVVVKVGEEEGGRGEEVLVKGNSVVLTTGTFLGGLIIYFFIFLDISFIHDVSFIFE